MKKHLLLKPLLTLALVLACGNAWGDTWTYTFASPDAISDNSITVNGATWTVATTSGTGSPAISAGNSYSKYGLKFGSSSSNYFGSVSFSTNFFNDKNVKSVTANILNNGKKTGTFTASQGSITIGSVSLEFSNPWTDLTASGTSGNGGALVLTYSVAQAFYVNSITVTYEDPSVEKTLKSITVSNPKTNFYVGDEFEFGGSVMASYEEDEIDDNDVTSFSSFTGYDMSQAGTQTVTVSYTEKSITKTDTYSITVSEKPQTGVFELYAAELVEGDYVIMDLENGNAMKNTIESNRLSYSSITPSDKIIANPDDNIIWHIAKNGDYWTFYNESIGKYAASNGTKNQAALADEISDNALWSIELKEGKFDVINKANDGKGVNASLRNNGTYGFACYGASSYHTLTFYKMQVHSAPISDAKYATLCLPFNFTVPEGVTAYTAEASASSVALTAIEGVVPANTGVIIYSETPGAYTFTGSTETPATLGTNNLVGVTAATELASGYILAKDTDGTAKFFTVTPNTTLAANKAYLDYSGSASALSIRMGDATGIRTVEEQQVNTYFDLMGRKVQNPERGIYILNGKKVFVK